MQCTGRELVSMHHLRHPDAHLGESDTCLMHQETWLKDAISSAAGVAEFLCQTPSIQD